MNIKVKILRTNEIKNISIQRGSTIQDLLKKINMKPDTIIMMNKNQPVPIDDPLNEEQELTIIQVSSGG